MSTCWHMITLLWGLSIGSPYWSQINDKFELFLIIHLTFFSSACSTKSQKYAIYPTTISVPYIDRNWNFNFEYHFSFFFFYNTASCLSNLATTISVCPSHQQTEIIYKDYLYTSSRCESSYLRANGSNVNTCTFGDHYVKLSLSVMVDWRPGDYNAVARHKHYNRLNRYKYIHYSKQCEM